MGNDHFATQDDFDSVSEDRPLMGIGQRCFISQAIIDKNVRIGNDVKITGGHHLEDGEYEKHTVVDGIVIIQKGTILPDGYSI